MDNRLSMKEKEEIITYIAKCYKKAKKRKELMGIENMVSENKKECKSDQTLLYLVDSTIDDLNLESRRIIETEYFTNCKENWYEDYYTKSTYYRLKKTAIDTFIDCLNV